MTVIQNPDPNLLGAATLNGVPLVTQQELNDLRQFWNELLPSKVNELVFNGAATASGSTPTTTYSNLQTNLIHKTVSLRPTVNAMLSDILTILDLTTVKYKDLVTATIDQIISYGIADGTQVVLRGGYSTASGGTVSELTLNFTMPTAVRLSVTATLVTYTGCGVLDAASQVLSEIPLPASASPGTTTNIAVGSSLAGTSLAPFRYRTVPLTYFALFAR
jgi:hypothetical protein